MGPGRLCQAHHKPGPAGWPAGIFNLNSRPFVKYSQHPNIVLLLRQETLSECIQHLNQHLKTHQL